MKKPKAKSRKPKAMAAGNKDLLTIHHLLQTPPTIAFCFLLLAFRLFSGRLSLFLGHYHIYHLYFIIF